MLIVSYDIKNDKLRTEFAKYIKKFGYRLQYSVFEIKNSERVLENITAEIENRFEKRFSDADSILIFKMSQTCKITKFGYAKHDDDDIIIVG